MSIPRILPVVLGAVAIVATIAVLAIYAVLAYSLTSTVYSVQISSIFASALEALVAVALSWLLYSHAGTRSLGRCEGGFGAFWLGLSLFLCTIAAAASVVAVVCLGNAHSTTHSARVPVSTSIGFMIGLSATLAISFVAQLAFLVVYYIVHRVRPEGTGYAHRGDHGTEKVRRRSPPRQVKSILYHQTSLSRNKVRGSSSMESRTPPGSSAGRSAVETMSSIRTSLSHAVRPISSKTRLLPGSQRSSRRQSSVDSFTTRDRSSAAEDGFDSWDTSSVDPHNRQTVLESSPPVSTRFLETIPASPTTSRSPSPGTPLDLEPPTLKTRQRSRSYSPAPQGSGTSQRAPFTMQSTASETHIHESHIHPLFRSDSPTPPTATPGTIVTAAPNGGRVISDRQSVRTLNRMRSGSLPVSRSPLSRQGSADNLPTRSVRAESYSPEPSPKVELDPEAERKMTPPIPDWILSAGSRTSLSGYQGRKLKAADRQEAETSGGQI